MSSTASTNATRGGHHVVVLGAGGNIGSHLVPLIARLGFIAKLTLVDPDTYEGRNLANQRIGPADLGRLKVDVQAEWVQRTQPSISVAAIPMRLEHLPRGRLRCDLVLSCLDSRAARQMVNEIVTQLGLRWIDAGVDAEEQLARITVLSPSAKQACLECTWGQREYETLEQIYSCQGARLRVPPTGATAALGSLAASLQALECERVLRAGLGTLQAGRLVALSARGHRVMVGRLKRNPRCLLSPHDRLDTTVLNCERLDLTFERLLRLHQPDGQWTDARLWAAGTQFVTRFTCPKCHHGEDTLMLLRSMETNPPACTRCGAPVRVAAGGVTDALDPSLPQLSSGEMTLKQMGCRPGEILTVETRGRAGHYEFAVEGERP
jgi:molybdopterin/thiamine biosynthesis adenylyltransferase